MNRASDLCSHEEKKDHLDMGCGTGRHALEMARRGYRAVGIDVARSYLDQAVNGCIKRLATPTGIEVSSAMHLFTSCHMLCEPLSAGEASQDPAPCFSQTQNEASHS